MFANGKFFKALLGSDLRSGVGAILEDDRTSGPNNLSLYGDFLPCQALRHPCLPCGEMKPRTWTCRQELTRNP